MQSVRKLSAVGAITKSGLIITFSQDDPELAVRQLAVLYQNGVLVVEYMSRTPNSDLVFSHLKKWKDQFAKDCFLGVGTVKTLDQLKIYQELEADFFVSPMYLSGVKNTESFLYIPGVSTPNEIWSVFQQGFSICKIFPISSLGGPNYIKSIKSPFPEVQFIPSGGILLDEKLIMDYKKSGALCVSLGGSFWSPFSVPSWEKIMQEKTRNAVELTGKYFG